MTSRLIVGLIGVTLILSTLAFGAVHYWALGFLCLGAGLVVVLWCADAWRTGAIRFRASWLQLPLAAIAVLGLVQLLPLRRIPLPGDSAPSWTAFTGDPFATRMTVVLIVVLLVYFAAALAFIDSRRRVNRLAMLIVVFGVVIALLGLIQHFVSPLKIYGIREPNQALPFGPFINRNHFAAFLVMIVPLPLALILERAVRSDRMVLYGFGALLMAVAVVMTGARGGLITLTAAMGSLLFIRAVARRREEVKRWRPIALAGAVLAALVLIVSLVVVLGGGSAVSRILGQSPAGDPVAGDRLHYWRTSAKMIAHHPVIGVGLDAFGVAYPHYDSLNGAYRVERAHNDYLQALAETGIVGAVIGLAFILTLFRQGWLAAKRTHDRRRAAVIMGSLAGCVGVLVHSAFEFPLRTPSNALLFLLLTVLATVETGSSRESSGAKKTALAERGQDAGTYRLEPSDRAGDDHL